MNGRSGAAMGTQKRKRRARDLPRVIGLCGVVERLESETTPSRVADVEKS